MGNYFLAGYVDMQNIMWKIHVQLYVKLMKNFFFENLA